MSKTPAPEFSRPIDRRQLSDKPVRVSANADECAALAKRFALVAIDRLEASVVLVPEGERIDASGKIMARITQTCAISGDPLRVTIAEPVAFRFVPAAAMEADEADEEIELSAEDLDEIGYTGSSFDLGEAVAQSLALAIDPYACGPDAESVREKAGLTAKGADGPLQRALGAALGGKQPRK